MRKKKYKYNISFSRFNFLFFVSGILIGLMVYFYTEANYEDKIFEQLSNDLHSKALNLEDTTQSVQMLAILDFVHNFINPRQKFFPNINGVGGVKSNIQPLTVDLMTGQGACGSYALVMARLLKEMDIPFRLVQMKVDGKFGGHIILEAEYETGKWAVLDPLYNLSFKDEKGELASFDEVKNNWKFYSMQVPADYDRRYTYDDRQYTNWEKVPVIMPETKKILEIFLGKDKVDKLSLRSLVLNKYSVFFNCTLFLQIVLVVYMVYYAFRKKHFSFHLASSPNANANQQGENQNGNLVLMKTSSSTV